MVIKYWGTFCLKFCRCAAIGVTSLLLDVQSQQVKRISTHFTTPAKAEKKSSQPKSEALLKLLDEKAREKQQKQEAEKKERRKGEQKRKQS